MVDRQLLRTAEHHLDRDGVPVRLEPAGRAGVRVMCAGDAYTYPVEFTVHVSRRAGAREVIRRVIAGLDRLHRLPPAESIDRRPQLYRAGAN